MSKSSVNLFFLLAIVVVSLFITQAVAVSVQDKGKHTHYKYTVYILNGCESGIEMPIHGQCFHVGNFTLIRLWQQYHWSFSVSYTKDVTYQCNLSRGYSRSQRQSIVAFNLDRDSDERRCGGTGECYWKITEVGIYFGNNNSTWTKAYNWSSIPDHNNSRFVRPQQLPKNASP
ncbi:conserved hypothetical protein [Ricinus communis]|uniref:Uncharacterized protein n=1 Tax=Ricinus communis TaxID=3988 RepID=B9RWQ5_RICCO|nr:conserved hypothetical protein [Ricinus communis]|eukprot:XP_002518174.1 uncharacterized protein LOC8265667 [Ricinus communis]